MPHKTGFRAFVLRVLGAAGGARSTELLAAGCCRALTEVVGCRVVELWLPEEGGLARWRLDAVEDHFARGPTLGSQLVQELRLAGVGGAPEPNVAAQHLVALVRAALGEDVGGLACGRLGPHPRVTGMLVLAGCADEELALLDESLLGDLTQVLSAALVHRQLQHARRERVKELSCLYALAKLATEPGLDLEGSLQRVVALLPPSWQHPEYTAARLVLDGTTFTTRPFDPSWSAQRAAIVVGDLHRGFVEVAYTRSMPAQFEGPFLEEERHLLDTVAREVSTLIERKAAIEDRIALQDQLQHADRLATMGHLAAGVAHDLTAHQPGSLAPISQDPAWAA